MTDAPERIWAKKTTGWCGIERGVYQNTAAMGGDEYVRADLHAAELAKAYAEGLVDAATTAEKIDADWQEKTYNITYNRKRYTVIYVIGMIAKALNIQSEDAAAAIRALPNKYEVK